MRSEREKILVLGATGFLGAYTCLALDDAGYEVVAVGRRASDNGFFAERGIRYLGGFSIEREECFAELPVDVVAVVNLAGRMPARADFRPADYVDSIVRGTVNLCEWMRRSTSCRKVVFNTTPSDVWHEFAAGKFVGDDVPRRYPATAGDHDVYAIAKIAATDILDHYRLACGIKAIVFRHLNVYGFHPSAKYVVDGEVRISPWRILMRQAIAGDDITVYGDPERKLELLSVYDFARAVVRAIRSDCHGVFNLAGVRPYSIEEEIRTLVSVFGCGNRIFNDLNRPSRMETLLSRQKAERELGWTPCYDWEQTCRTVRREFAENRFRKLWGDVAPEDVRRNTLAVVGAGYLQLPLVRKAKEMGLRVICFAWAEGAVCKEVCDRFYPISVIEKEKILEVCRQEHVDGITSIASDVAVPTIAYVAEALGLCGNSVESAIKSTDKYQMRKALSAAGIPCPPFVEVDETDDLEGKIGSLRFPLVVKPVDRSGSMGVAQVEDLTQLDRAVKVAVSDSLSGRCIVENCITNMREVSVEGISWQGHYRMLAITDKVTTGCPHYVELAHHQPARVNDHLKGRIEDVVRRAVSALGITTGATHVELMITASDELYVTEVGARMGGDFIGASLVQLSTGYDFLRAVVQCAMGELAEQGPQPHQSCSGVWFYAPQTKWVKDVIVRKTDQRIVTAELQKDDAVELTRSADRSGYFIYAGEDRWEASLA